MNETKYKTGANLMRYKWLYLAFSALILIPGIISLSAWGLKLSIDFTGGTLLELQMPESVSPDYFYQKAGENSLELSSVQASSDNTYLLRLKPIDAQTNETFKASLGEDVVEKRFETVGPVVGRELTRKAFWSVSIASIAIVLYIAWAFRQVPPPYSPWKFGLSAVIALIHDSILVLGIFSLLGHFLNVEVDAMFVTAMLTVIGYSVHDTIVVFDRIRENLPKMAGSGFENIVNFSITETLARSLNTSFTVIFTLLALLIFGGESIRWFTAALLIGITAGTYSSIFNATPILVLWESKKR